MVRPAFRKYLPDPVRSEPTSSALFSRNQKKKIDQRCLPWHYALRGVTEISPVSLILPAPSSIPTNRSFPAMDARGAARRKALYETAILF